MAVAAILLAGLALIAHPAAAQRGSPATATGRQRAIARREAARTRRDAVVAAGAAGAAALTHLAAFEGASAEDVPVGPRVVIETSAGEMHFELWPDVAPKHVESFLSLARQGFYDGQAFHRVIDGFVIQGGDPNSKNPNLYDDDGRWTGTDRTAIRRLGTGGPGYNVDAEFNARKHELGVLSMARAQDPNSAGSQFFVCLGDLPSLDGKYTTFGKTIDSQSDRVLRSIGSTATIRPGDYPVQRQGINKVRVASEP